MKSNYERIRFVLCYIGIVVCTLIGLAIYLHKCTSLPNIEIGVVLCGVFVVLLLIFIFTYANLNWNYRNMEHIAEIMDQVSRDSENVPEEEFCEGTVGVLYSNFYKMVRALQESRNRELDEKKFLRDIISDISHQLKTPMASLKIFVELLEDDKIQDPDKKKQVLKEAENQLDRMEWMVLSMLKLARIEARAIVFDKKKHKINQVLHQAEDGVRSLVEQRKQKLIIEDAGDWEILCDRDWLSEAILNLLKNASDYSEEGKTIRIAIEDSMVCTRIKVCDEGIGIPESEIANIFKRFYRVNQEVNPNSVGIGLALSKSIIEGMGGTIQVRSEVGVGTTFLLTFMKS